MGPGVVEAKLQAKSRYTSAIYTQLKSVVGGMPTVAPSIDIAEIWIQALAVQVVRADGSDSRRDAGGIRQTAAADPVKVISGVEPDTARAQVGRRDDKRRG